MKIKYLMVLASMASAFMITSAYAAGQDHKMDARNMEQHMREQMQKIVDEPDQPKRQAIMNEQLKQMQPHFKMCQEMMGEQAMGDAMSHAKTGTAEHQQ